MPGRSHLSISRDRLRPPAPPFRAARLDRSTEARGRAGGADVPRQAPPGSHAVGSDPHEKGIVLNPPSTDQTGIDQTDPDADADTDIDPDTDTDESGDLKVTDARKPAAELSFAELGVLPATVAALEDVGITHPFPIQALTLPVALHGHDIIGQAKTGTGKTLGFGIPLLQRVFVEGDETSADGTAPPVPGKPQALVVVPTRELCVQVTSDIAKAATKRPIRTLSVYGGRAYEPQVEALRKGVEVVVGTPGRLIDLANQGLLDLGHVRTLVLDEADEMLDLGFLPDVERIVRLVPSGRQTMLFSATMPGQIITLARQYMHHPTHIRAVDPDDGGATVKAVEQHVFRAHALDKIEMLARILQAEGRGLTLVFCRTKRTAAKVADELADRGFASGAVHGDLGQGAREQALRAFRGGKVDVLVATDVAARGIDVEDITHVVNYQCPDDEKTYLHRIGRTARAGKSGVAITFVDWDETPRWMLIDKALDLGFGEPEETYSNSEHLYAELEIPREVTGRLPRAQRTRAGLAAEEIEDLGETGRHGGQGRGERSGGGSAGSRSGGGRPRGDRATRPARPARADEGSREDAAREPRPRRDRQRRRTRGGAAEEGPGPVPATAEGPGAAAEGPAGDAERVRRRRRRGGRNRTSGGSAEGAAATGDGPE
jgi:superfamily II DNA/RNA helicase